jgi:hypothetical protein
MKEGVPGGSWYQVERHRYGMPTSIVSQPVLGLKAATTRLTERQAAEHDASYSYALASCPAPKFQPRRSPWRVGWH